MDRKQAVHLYTKSYYLKIARVIYNNWRMRRRQGKNPTNIDRACCTGSHALTLYIYISQAVHWIYTK